MKQLLFLIGLLLASTSMADDVTPQPQPQPEPQKSTLPSILLPMTPVLVEPDAPAPAPNPQPAPAVITNLPSDTWFIVESRTPLVVFDVPEGHVSVREFDITKGGSRSFIGKFVDGTGKADEERTYPTDAEYKFIYCIRSKQAGKTGLVLTPVGVLQKSDITVVMLTVGIIPNPPPKPEPGPTPEPDPGPSPVKAENIRICIIEDVLNRSPETAAVLNSLVGWTAFADAGNQYRLYDKATKEAAGVAAVAAAGTTPLPAMVVYDNKTGALITATALPGSFSGFKTIVEGLVK